MIGPATSRNPLVEQIYPIVNEVFKQMTGRTDIKAVDTASLVAMGQEIENLQKGDVYLNTLARRIGLTIDDWRVYKNQFADLYRTQVEWGAAIQKLTSEMPEAEYEDMYDLRALEGKSVDPYVISIPKVHQRIFDKETPYSFKLTTPLYLLYDAFLSAAAKASFINQIFGKVRNKIEFVLEELARICMCNFILNTKDFQHYHLVRMYNSTGPETSVTTASAMHDANFLRYAVGQINNISTKMERMSVLYNSDGFDRFTPKSMQRFYMISDFMTILQTVVSYEAFNPNFVTAKPDILLPFWQASKRPNDVGDFSTVTCIQGSVKNDKGVSVEKTLPNVIGILFDWDAMGTFRQQERVLTTPVNARAAYYNTFWHEKQLWFNDMSENGVVFFLD